MSIIAQPATVSPSSAGREGKRTGRAGESAKAARRGMNTAGEARRPETAGSTGGGSVLSSSGPNQLFCRRDSSIGATSSNPRLRQGSIVEAAVAARRSQLPRSRSPVDWGSAASCAAMRRLRRVFLPVLMRVVLRRRRGRGTTTAAASLCALCSEGGASVLLPSGRRYTVESVLAVLTAPPSPLAQWPLSFLELLARRAIVQSLRPGEFAVYAGESHLSCGLIVLLHGQLLERRREGRISGRTAGVARVAGVTTMPKTSSGEGRPASRAVHAQRVRTRYAPNVLCANAVLCEDRTPNALLVPPTSLTAGVVGSSAVGTMSGDRGTITNATSATRVTELVDIALIDSRTFWSTLYNFLLESVDGPRLRDLLEEYVLPARRDMLLADYYPTSLLWRRSWIWPFLDFAEARRLAESMDVVVLNVGDVLYQEGMLCPWIYVVRRGTLTIVVKGEPLAVVEPGTAFGEVSVLFGDPRNCTVVAATVCELYALHARELHRRLRRTPSLLQALVTAALARRLCWMEAGKSREVFGLAALLSIVPCLSHATELMRRDLAHSARVVTVPRGYCIVHKGTPCQALFVIGRGFVRRVGGGDGEDEDNFDELGGLGRDDGDLRGPGEFFGELCLYPHLWPTSVRAVTSVDLWALSSEAVRRVLAPNKADVQAEEVCRQGVALYRAQKGENSILDMPLMAPLQPTTMATAATPTRPRSSVSGVSAVAVLQPRQSRTRSASATSMQRGRAAQPSLSADARRGRGQQVEPARPLRAPQRRRSAGGSTASGGRASVEFSHDRPPRASRAGSSSVVSLSTLSPILSALEELKLHLDEVDWEEYISRRDMQLARSRYGAAVLTSSDSPPRRSSYGARSESSTSAAPRAVVTTRSTQREGDELAEAARPAKVLELISIPRDLGVADADCDFPAEVSELQGIIVEQLLLTPVPAQPRFLRQMNNSNVRLVAESASGEEAEEGTGLNGVADALYVASSRSADLTIVPVGTVQGIEELPAAGKARQEIHALNESPAGSARRSESRGRFVPPMDLDDLAAHTTTSTAGGGGGVCGTPGLRGRLLSFHEGFGSIAQYTLRPPSSRNPFAASPSCVSQSVRPSSALGSSSTSADYAVLELPPVRPGSVDLNAVKVSADRSSSTLDRFVRLEDATYFDALVRVNPVAQDVMELPEEVIDAMPHERGEAVHGAAALLLLHLQQCDRLAPAGSAPRARVVALVRLSDNKDRVLLRTPPFASSVQAISWPIETVSFIGIVSLGAVLECVICDAADERTVILQCTLPVHQLRQTGGVGRWTLTLHRGEGGSRAVSTSDSRGPPSPPRVTMTTMVVTASRYKTLHQCLATTPTTTTGLSAGGLSDGAADMTGVLASSAADPLTMALRHDEGKGMWLYVLAVHGLRHRIEAAVTVSLLVDGERRPILRTPTVVPKTTQPTWTAATALTQLSTDTGGFLVFELHHRGSTIAMSETTVDEWALGEPGLRRLPLCLLARRTSEVIGELHIAVLKATRVARATATTTPMMCAVLQIEHLTLEDAATTPRWSMPPDLFVLLREAEDGPVVLRTPMLFGSLVGSWSAPQASCLLPCPTLPGSSVMYTLQVCDGDEGSVVGNATLVLNTDGLGAGSCFDVRLQPAHCGHVRLRALCLPILALNATRGGGRHEPQVQYYATPSRLLTTRTLREEAVLFIHIAQCTVFADADNADMRTEALVTLSLAGTVYLRTASKAVPMASSPACSRWDVAVASALWQVPSSADHADEVSVELYDGALDEADRIARGTVRLLRLCHSDTIDIPLYPTLPAADEADDRPGAVDGHQLPYTQRAIGEVRLSTLYGRVGTQFGMEAQVATTDDSIDDVELLLTSMDDYEENGSSGAPVTVPAWLRDRHVEGADGVVYRGLTPHAGRLRLSLLSLCPLTPLTARRCVQLAVTHADSPGSATPMLVAERTCGAEGGIEWDIAEAVAAFDLATIERPLTVRLTITAIEGGCVSDYAGTPVATQVTTIPSAVHATTSGGADAVDDDDDDPAMVAALTRVATEGRYVMRGVGHIELEALRSVIAAEDGLRVCTCTIHAATPPPASLAELVAPANGRPPASPTPVNRRSEMTLSQCTLSFLLERLP